MREPHREHQRRRFYAASFLSPYNVKVMAEQTTVDQLVERVERLLLRHEELQRTNALLTAQLQALTQERDSLKSRLNAARARVDALLERLPEPPASPEASSPT